MSRLFLEIDIRSEPPVESSAPEVPSEIAQRKSGIYEADFGRRQCVIVRGLAAFSITLDRRTFEIPTDAIVTA